jgi:hypothetical protein
VQPIVIEAVHHGHEDSGWSWFWWVVGIIVFLLLCALLCYVLYLCGSVFT